MGDEPMNTPDPAFQPQLQPKPAVRDAAMPYHRILVAVDAPGHDMAVVPYVNAAVCADAEVRVVAYGAAAARSDNPYAGSDETATDEPSAPDAPQADHDPARRLAMMAKQTGADLIAGPAAVLTHLAHLVHIARVPVLVIPQEPDVHVAVPPQRLFVASDGSDASRDALREATRIAGTGATVRVAHIAREAAGFVRNTDVGIDVDGEIDTATLQTRWRGEQLPQAIVEAALQWRADLLIVGTHGGVPTGKWRFGSMAEQIRAFATMPLLLVPYRAASTE